MSIKRDQVFKEYLNNLSQFRFNENVAKAFDDMAARSIPSYLENQPAMGIYAQTFYKENTKIYDLGCSIGTISLACADALKDKNPHIIALDNSQSMISQAQEKLSEFKQFNIELRCQDILDLEMEDTSLVYFNYTLQFMHPDSRDQVIEKIYKAMIPGGALILSEKIISENPIFEQLQQDRYYIFKRNNGYSNLELSQKRDALESFLRPESVESHISRLSRTGFKHAELWSRNMNFASFIAIK